MIRLFSICNNDFYLRVLEPYLAQHNIMLADVCRDPAHAPDQYSKSRCHVALLDACWYNNATSGSDVMRALLQRDPSAKIIIVNNSPGPLHAHRITAMGAAAYFCRINSSIEFLVRCIQEVHAGQATLADHMARPDVGTDN